MDANRATLIGLANDYCDGSGGEPSVVNGASAATGCSNLHRASALARFDRDVVPNRVHCRRARGHQYIPRRGPEGVTAERSFKGSTLLAIAHAKELKSSELPASNEGEGEHAEGKKSESVNVGPHERRFDESSLRPYFGTRPIDADTPLYDSGDHLHPNDPGYRRWRTHRSMIFRQRYPPRLFADPRLRAVADWCISSEKWQHCAEARATLALAESPH